MPRKQVPTKLNLLNERGRYKTWHFTSVLTPTEQIRGDLNWIVTHNTNVAHPHISLVKACIKEKVINKANPECVTYISWRFSHAHAASWVSNTRDKIQLFDLPFEGYIQSTVLIDLPRLHRWMQDAIWENVSGKLALNRKYHEFSAPNDAV
jgi:hypothetical protein